jgi:ubiquitin carboxyl-terminal hydrolase 25
MNKYPYHLHAICIHDGSAQSGHYYAFIYDRYQKKWHRFNDMRVVEVSEEDVFNESNGGNGLMNAYWVVYVNNDIANEMAALNLHTYRSIEGQVIIT